MIVIAVSVKIKPEKRGIAVLDAMAMADASRKEDGCLRYEFSVDIQDPHRFLVFEQWENQAALDAHSETEHMATFREQLPVFVDGPLEIKRYVVDSVSDI
jgi:quinol monooxygenase YgiN